MQNLLATELDRLSKCILSSNDLWGIGVFWSGFSLNEAEMNGKSDVHHISVISDGSGTPDDEFEFDFHTEVTAWGAFDRYAHQFVNRCFRTMAEKFTDEYEVYGDGENALDYNQLTKLTTNIFGGFDEYAKKRNVDGDLPHKFVTIVGNPFIEGPFKLTARDAFRSWDEFLSERGSIHIELRLEDQDRNALEVKSMFRLMKAKGYVKYSDRITRFDFNIDPNFWVNFTVFLTRKDAETAFGRAAPTSPDSDISTASDTPAKPGRPKEFRDGSPKKKALVTLTEALIAAVDDEVANDPETDRSQYIYEAVAMRLRGHRKPD